MSTIMPRKVYKMAEFLVSTLLVYCLTALICCLFCSYPLWFPSMKHFLHVFVPNVYSRFINPKCLFIVGNMIIIVIIFRESKVNSGSKLSSATEVFDGHMESTRSSTAYDHSTNSHEKKKEEERGLEKQILVVEREYQYGSTSDDQEDECHVKKNTNVIQEEEEEEEVGNYDQEEKDGMVDEELTRRVEDFIARVNRQRWLEDNLLVCCRA